MARPEDTAAADGHALACANIATLVLKQTEDPELHALACNLLRTTLRGLGAADGAERGDA